MRIELKKLLKDILTAISSIDDYLDGKRSFHIYQSNKLIRRAVEREVEIIGEAMNTILKTNPEIEIKNPRKIVDTRNWVIHSYDNVDDIIIWSIVTKHLPVLKLEIEVLLNEN